MIPLLIQVDARVSANLIVLSMFGGSFLLLFGIKLAGEGLRDYAGQRIKTALETMTKNRVAGFFTGILITFLLQSSSACTVTVVSLIEAGLMSFPQSLGVILGADVGTTITVQLISFRIYDYALFICGVGAALIFSTRLERRRHLGEGILGFGLIFLSIKLMSECLSAVKDAALFLEVLTELGRTPLLGILLAMALTAIIHSSAATIGLAIALSLDNLMPIETAVSIVLGANIGTTATALLGAWRGSVEAKRAAFANLFFKVVGVAMFYPFIHPFALLMARTSEQAPHQIANAHTVFNLGIALLLLPFTPLVARVVEGWLPDRPEAEEEEFKPKYLNPAMLSTPALALAQAMRETIRMAESVQDMLRLSLPAIMDCDLELIERVEKMDDNVDVLDAGIRFYLTQLSKEHLHTEDASRQMEILIVVSNLEAIGDVIDKNLMENARKKAKNCVQFSAAGQRDVRELHGLVLENLELAMSAFTTRDAALAERVFNNKRRIREAEKEFYSKHIARLESGLSESYETSSIHLDVLTNLKRINTHITNIVYPLRKTQQVE
jgi:phosphate:Na+ symporter